jgi:hypothetical protein
MPQIALNKFPARQSGRFQAVGAVAILPAEGDGVPGDLADARISDGSAGDVGAQIFKGRGAAACGLNVHAPILAPDLGVHLPAMDLEELAQVLTEGGLEMGQVNQEVGLLDAAEPAALIESGAGDQTMDVRMKA